MKWTFPVLSGGKVREDLLRFGWQHFEKSL